MSYEPHPPYLRAQPRQQWFQPDRRLPQKHAGRSSKKYWTCRFLKAACSSIPSKRCHAPLPLQLTLHKKLAGPPRVKRGTGRWRRYAISLRGCASTCKLAGGIPHAHGHGKHWRVDSKANKAKLLHLLPEKYSFHTTPQADQALRLPAGLYAPSGQIRPGSYTYALLQKWRVQPCTARCRKKRPG